MLMPPMPGFVANRPAYDAWRQAMAFPSESLFDVAAAKGLSTAIIGQPDFHALHIAGAAVGATVVTTDAAGAAAALHDLRAQHPQSLVLVAIGGARTGDRHDPTAIAELSALASAVAAIVNETGSDTLVAITSRGATVIDDPTADRYGAGTSRHVPLILIGPNVRAGAISGQPASLADLPATILFGLGMPTVSDVGTGTWIQGAPAIDGVPQPVPNGAAEGRVLTRGFVLP
jgi:hypothetical protein